MQAKLREIDEKLAIIQNAKAELTRLEDFLWKQRAACETSTAQVQGSYLQHVQVSPAEMAGMVKRAQDILRRFQ
jgi:hypothetical protein